MVESDDVEDDCGIRMTLDLLLECYSESMEGFETPESMLNRRTAIAAADESDFTDTVKSHIQSAQSDFAECMGANHTDFMHDATRMAGLNPAPIRALTAMLRGAVMNADDLIDATDRVCGRRDHPIPRPTAPNWMNPYGKSGIIDRDDFIIRYWRMLVRMTITAVRQMSALDRFSESDMAFALMAGGSKSCLPCSVHSAIATMAMAEDMISPCTHADFALMAIDSDDDADATDDGLGPVASRLVEACGRDSRKLAYVRELAERILIPRNKISERHRTFMHRVLSYMEGEDAIGGVSEAFAAMALGTMNAVGVNLADFPRTLSRMEARELGDESRRWPTLVVSDSPTISGMPPSKSVPLPTLRKSWDAPLDDIEWALSVDFHPETARELKGAFRRMVMLSVVAGSPVAEYPDGGFMPVTKKTDDGGFVYGDNWNCTDSFEGPLRTALYLRDAGLMRDAASVHWFVSALGNRRDDGVHRIRVHMDAVDDAIEDMCAGYPIDFIRERLLTRGLPPEPTRLGEWPNAKVTESVSPTASARHVYAIGMLVIDAREITGGLR